MYYIVNKVIYVINIVILQELSYLLPDISLDIQMYGNEISKVVDGHTYEHNNLHIEVKRGIYHRKSSTSRKPHLALGIKQYFCSFFGVIRDLEVQ